MNADSPLNAMPEYPLNSQETAPAAISRTRLLYWSIRRELWENRSIYVAPLAVSAVILVGFLTGTFHPRGGHVEHDDALMKPYDFAALALMGAALIVSIFYCLDALYGERRDRSILFWKSLPVSDLTTVLSKASIPLLILPLITFAITVVTQLIMLLLSSAVLLGKGQSVATLSRHVPLFSMSLGLFYHLLAIHALWYAPFYGWFLLVSAWARRAPILWASLPPLAIGIAEKLAFNTSHFANVLRTRFLGGPEATSSSPGSGTMDSLKLATVADFLSSPGLWIGLALFVAFLAAAIRLRRYREPI